MPHLGIMCFIRSIFGDLMSVDVCAMSVGVCVCLSDNFNLGTTEICAIKCTRQAYIIDRAKRCECLIYERILQSLVSEI